MEKLLTTIFGENCYFCGAAGKLICYKCESVLKVCRHGVCIKCQRESVMGETHLLCRKGGSGLPSQLCSIYEYGGLTSEIIKISKYEPKRFSLLRHLSRSGVKIASKLGFNFTGFTVIPIPISRARERERGFNQSDIIAQAVCKEFGLNMINSILTRIHDTDKQYGLDKTERGKNMEGVFEVKGCVKEGKFLLVDDICTTGSTFLSSAGVLLKQGALEVRCFSIARKI